MKRERLKFEVALDDSTNLIVSTVPWRTMNAEFKRVFPEAPSQCNTFTLVVVTQQLAFDLLDHSHEASVAKTKACQRFFTVASSLCSLVGGEHWIDYTDPATGYPMKGNRGGAALAEVDTIQRITGWQVELIGGCTILKHPQWLASFYPGCIVTSAPFETLRDLLLDQQQNLDLLISL